MGVLVGDGGEGARRRAWEAALAEHRRSFAAVEASQDEDEVRALCAAQKAAFDRMLATPAPDAAAVREKLAAAQASGFVWDARSERTGGDLVELLMADLDRLGGKA